MRVMAGRALETFLSPYLMWIGESDQESCLFVALNAGLRLDDSHRSGQPLEVPVLELLPALLVERGVWHVTVDAEQFRLVMCG
jgi:hypothetical protein